ncbi:uncharacterized protein LOC113332645 [Papaver somniferum]|uniref:uncharacterized protein LOC113332645 n=1 Tax=Papaver somniferum TaxID=3469 RepID=UPI000E6F4FA9|nr:uncharacterized protein LOC113332645 [Papaver somniferum]
MLFDRGKGLEGIIRYSYYVQSKFEFNGKFVYDLVLQQGYKLYSMCTNSTECVFIKEGDCFYVRELIVKIPQRDVITNYVSSRMLFDRGKMFETWFWNSLSECLDGYYSNIYQHQAYTRVIECWLVLMCAGREECSYCILIFTGRVIDRGRMFGLRRRSSYYASISSAFCAFILTSRIVALSISVLRYTYDWKFLYEIILKLGYLLEFLFASLMVILSAEDGGSGAARKLSYKMQLQCDSLLTTNLSFQMSRQDLQH